MLLILQLTHEKLILSVAFFSQLSFLSTGDFNGAVKGSGRRFARKKRPKPSHFSFIYSECVSQEETEKWSQPNPAVPLTVATPAEVHIGWKCNAPPLFSHVHPSVFTIRALDLSGTIKGLRESERCARVLHLLRCCPLEALDRGLRGGGGAVGVCFQSFPDLNSFVFIPSHAVLSPQNAPLLMR